ncbi:MAG: haloacid dehalogenase [Actinobacteria bacterium]|nr:haloacid dehalogenase [Actinomycetota bacterium]
MAALVEPVREELASAHRAREQGLAACRRTIRAAGLSIRAVHRNQPDEAAARLAEAASALVEAQQALAPHPAVAYAGFLHDAEKELAEAVLAAALIEGTPLPGHAEVGVSAPAWLNGLAEAASELRRYLLDRLRAGELTEGERLLAAMDDVYDLLVSVDFPDAITGGLRRTTDSLRAVLERTRSDLTLTLVQARLHHALEVRRPEGTG